MYIDIAILIVIIISVAFGIKKGFVFEFFSLFGFLISVFITKRISVVVYENFGGSNTGVKFIITYVTIFFIVYLTLFLIIVLIRKFFKLMLLGWLDRLLGALTGLVKSLLISIVIVFISIFIANYSENYEKEVKKSIVCNMVVDILPDMKLTLPSKINEKVENYKKNRNTEIIIQKSMKEIEKIMIEGKKNTNLTEDKIKAIKELELREIDKKENDINEILNQEIKKDKKGLKK